MSKSSLIIWQTSTIVAVWMCFRFFIHSVKKVSSGYLADILHILSILHLGNKAFHFSVYYPLVCGWWCC